MRPSIQCGKHKKCPAHNAPGISVKKLLFHFFVSFLASTAHRARYFGRVALAFISTDGAYPLCHDVYSFLFRGIEPRSRFYLNASLFSVARRQRYYILALTFYGFRKCGAIFFGGIQVLLSRFKTYTQALCRQ